jgi:galactokinase
LDEVTRRRARHVITENARTVQAADAMHHNDPIEMGRLMCSSHASLRDDFEVSSEKLDAMVSCAEREDGCYGARMTGAGFGGCAIALVKEETATTFAASVAACYRETAGIEPGVTICAAGNGANVVVGPAGCQGNWPLPPG